MPSSYLLHRTAEFGFLSSLCLTLVFPLILGPLKLVLFAYAVVVLLVLELISRKSVIGIHRASAEFMAALIAINCVFVLRGLLNGISTEASREIVLVYLIYPIFYFLVILLFPSVINLRSLTKLLVFVSIIISYLTIVQFLRVLGFGEFPGYTLLYFVYPDLAGGSMNYAFTGFDGFLPRATERLVFLAPFAVGLLVSARSLGLSRVLTILNFVVVVAATACTGRRAFLLILVLAVLVLLARWFLTSPRRATEILVASLSVAFLVVGGISLDGRNLPFSGAGTTSIGEEVTTNFTDFSFGIRSSQLGRIIGEADKTPIIGSGFGKVIAGYVRDPEHPWRLELTYAALLFQTGVIGIILYGILALQLFRIVFTAMKTAGRPLWPVIFGLGGGLLAVATNPYLNYGTGQWILFLPIAVCNSVIIGRAWDRIERGHEVNQIV